MNKRIGAFIMLCSLFVMQYSTGASCNGWFENNVKRDRNAKSFWASYLVSLVVSSGIGIATGGLTAYVENVIVGYMKKNLPQELVPLFWFLPFFTWAIESEVRADIITGIQSDLDMYQIDYKKNLMFKNACIASWLSYLKNGFIFSNA